MKQAKQDKNNREKFKSINNALNTLSDASDDSAEEIRMMVKKDYKKIKQILEEVKPDAQSTFSNLKGATTESVNQATKKAVTLTKEAAQQVDKSVHKSPWAFIGGAAIASTVVGFLLGRKSKC